MCATASSTCFPCRADGRGPSVETRARSPTASETSTVRGRPAGRGSVTSSARASSSIRIGGRATRPCELIVRQRSTGSPPAPLSGSSALQALGGIGIVLPLPRRDGERLARRPAEAQHGCAGLAGERAAARVRIPDVDERARRRVYLLAVHAERGVPGPHIVEL